MKREALHALACASAMLVASVSALAQLSDAERKCSDAFNKAVRNVGNQEQKFNRKCIRDSIGGDATACVNSVSPKAADRELQVEGLFTTGQKCETNAAFGVNNAGTPAGDDAGQAAEGGSDEILRDIWGDPVDGLVAGDKCADAIAKRTGKIYDTVLGGFRKCAREAASIAGIATLEACVGTAITDSKVATIAGKLNIDINNRCNAVAPIVAGTDDGECSGAATQAEFFICSLARARCNACLSINDYTGGNADCDALDDGSANGSCGVICGDGLVEGGEQCDPQGVNSPDCVNVGDTCSATCQCEAPVCGNGLVEGGEQCDPQGVNSPDCVNAGDTCSATCQCEAPVCGNGLLESTEECDPPGSSSCPFSVDTCNATCGCELSTDVHGCTFDGASDNSGLALCFLGICAPPLDIAGAVDLRCAASTQDGNGKRACQCTLRQFTSVELSGVGYVCSESAPGCPDGELDCDGGNALNVDLEANHELGACTSNAGCASQCGTYCSGIGKSVYDSGCESFCQGGINVDLPCQCDVVGAATCSPGSTTDCPGSSCEGTDNEIDQDCHCTCIDAAVGPASGAGQVACRLGVAIRVEASLPCDGADVLVRLPPQCAPLTSGTASLVLNGLNEQPDDYEPFSETGTDESCANFDTSITTGYELVSVLAFYDSTIGDLIARLTVDCQ